MSPPEKEEAPTTAEPTPTHDVVSPLEPSPTKEPPPPPPSDTALSNEKTLSKETPDPPQIFKEKLLQKALPSLPAEKTAPMDNNNNADIPKVRRILPWQHEYLCSLTCMNRHSIDCRMARTLMVIRVYTE